MHPAIVWSADTVASRTAAYDRRSSALSSRPHAPSRPQRGDLPPPRESVLTLLELRYAAMSGARWMIASRVGLQLITWPITIVVMRLLDPADYGLFALAIVVSSLLVLVAEFGFDAALIQASDPSSAEVRAACSMVWLLNALLAGGLWLSSDVLADAFDEPEVGALLRWMTLDLAFVALAVVPTAMLERRLQFRALSMVQMASGALSSAVTLGCALADLDVWSLICGALTLSGSKLVLVAITYRGLEWPGRLSRALVEPLWRMGRHVIASRVLWQWHSQSDQLVLGPIVSSASLGSWSFAAQFSMLPVSKVSGTLQRVALPVLSRLPAGSAAVSATHRKLIGLVAIYAVGVCWGIASVAPEFVLLALGVKWQSAVLPLAVLSAVAPLRMLGALNNLAATSAGRPEAATRELLVASLLLPMAVLFGARQQGLAGACAAWALVYPCIFLLSCRLTSRVVGLPMSCGLRPLVGPMLAGVAMVLVVSGVRRVAGSQWPVGALLTAQIATGAATYVAVLWTVSRHSLREALALAGELLGRRQDAGR